MTLLYSRVWAGPPMTPQGLILSSLMTRLFNFRRCQFWRYHALFTGLFFLLSMHRGLLLTLLFLVQPRYPLYSHLSSGLRLQITSGCEHTAERSDCYIHIQLLNRHCGVILLKIYTEASIRYLRRWLVCSQSKTNTILRLSTHAFTFLLCFIVIISSIINLSSHLKCLGQSSRTAPCRTALGIFSDHD
jgi:hypothetical protein